jgi:hypothetical protein
MTSCICTGASLFRRAVKPYSVSSKLARSRHASSAAIRATLPINHPIRWPGSWHRKAAPTLCHIVHAEPDREIDLNSTLETLRRAMPEAPKEESRNGADHAPDDGVPLADLINAVITGEKYHHSLVALAARCIGNGMHDGATVNLLRALMAASTAPHDARWLARRDAIPRIVRSAKEKFGSSPANAGKPLPFVLFDQIDITPKEWLAEKLLGVAEVSCWYGEPGSGKSVLIEDFGLHVAAGMPWLGRGVKRGAVLYIALERAQLVKRRALAFKLKHNAHGLPFAVMNGVLDLRDQRTAPVILQTVAELERATGEKVVLIIIDTISRALAGGDENSPKDMGGLIATLGKIQAAITAHLALIHHVPHEADRMRGHGSLLGAIDTSIHVAKGEAARSGTIVKANDADEGECVTFTLESVTLCAVGETTTTAPVIVPADDVAAKKVKLPADAKLALDLLTELTAEAGTNVTHESIPADVAIVPALRLRDAFLAAHHGDKRDTRKRAYNRAIERLLAFKLIDVFSDKVWLVGQAGQAGTKPGQEENVPAGNRRDTPTGTGGTPPFRGVPVVPAVPSAPIPDQWLGDFQRPATPFERPSSTSDFQLMGGTLDGDVCEHCGKVGNVLLIRDPRRGVESHFLHDACAKAFYQRG